MSKDQKKDVVIVEEAAAISPEAMAKIEAGIRAKIAKESKTTPAAHRGGTIKSAVTKSGHGESAQIRLYQQYRSSAEIMDRAASVGC